MDPLDWSGSAMPTTARVRRPPGRRRSLAPVIALVLTAGALVSARALAARIARVQAPIVPALPVAPPPAKEDEDAIAKLDALLVAIEKSVAEPARKTCPAIDRKVTAPIVAIGAREELSSRAVRTALDRKGGPEVRGPAARAVTEAPYLAVLTGVDRAWLLKRRGTWRGSFDGRVLLVDTKTAKPVCALPLSFETGSKVRTERIDDATMKSLKEELDARFPKEAAGALGIGLER
ncbi:MAG: hypothetical protein KIT84_21330 [Labilithrix sp.]|nr:hypothetical protein [Labilithrix sp.]MCW5813586.1 hypothetical protein [Labilithrix sp.]